MEEKPKRRERYSGKYPKTYSQKYKELNPEKYTETIEKVKSKGNTPVGMHIPIMVNEIKEVLKIKKGEIGFDCTLGYGGHTLEFLKELNHTGHMYCVDVDEVESLKTKERLEKLGYTSSDITIENINFKDLDLVLDDKKCDFLLADLGISSMQVDNPSRGFTFKFDGPLDLRLNQKDGITASELINNSSCKELEKIIFDNSDEVNSSIIAKAICSAKSNTQIDSTLKLYNIIKDCLKKNIRKISDEEIKKTCQRVFQALRIEINHEYDALGEFLYKLPKVMAPNGRIAILTFHSGEDRLVKKAFKEYYNDGVFSEISKDVIRPSKEEIFRNPRSKSTKLRYAVMKNTL